jgi:hypothetical protein
MDTNFQFFALDDADFAAYFSKNDAELSEINAKRMIVDEKPGFPCRVSLADAEVGEEVILLPFEHHAVSSPYRASGPIFVRKMAKTGHFEVNEIPLMFHHRLLSVRGYDKNALMISANVTEGIALKSAILTAFSDENVAYLHVHNARPGCFNVLVRRGK